MSESYINKYIIEVNSSHANTNYKVISTREGLTAMARTLLEKLEQPQQNLRRERQSEDSPIFLWSDYATIARGRTARVYLSFALAKDLDSYHIPPNRLKRFAVLFGLIVAIAILALAVVGIVAIVRGNIG